MADLGALERELSEPLPELVDAMRVLDGDLLVLGAGGKMGPSLVELALIADRAAGRSRRIVAVSRFAAGTARAALERAGAETIAADLLDPDRVAALPDLPLVIYLAGQKFGTTDRPAMTWAQNAIAPSLVARRFTRARIVAFSSGNVYPWWPADSAGPTETDPIGPVGEYAQSVVARERIFEYYADRHRTPLAILRLNYAIEPRYGVLRDIADRVSAGLPIDLGTPTVNLIWQRDANAIALRAVAHTAVPPLVLNLTGPAVSVRDIARRFGERFGKPATFSGDPAPTALLSNPALLLERFGPPPTGLDWMIERVAAWIEAGGGSLGKPTGYAGRSGRF